MTMKDRDNNANVRTVRYIYGENENGLANIESFPSASTFLSDSRIVVPRMTLEEYSSYCPMVLDYGMITATPLSNYNAYRLGEDLIWYSQVAELHNEGKLVHRFKKYGNNYIIHGGLGTVVPVEIGSLFSGGVLEYEKDTYRQSENGYTLAEKESYGYYDEEHPPLLALHIERKKFQNSTSDAPDFEEGYSLLFPNDIIPGSYLIGECPPPGYYYTYSDWDIYNPYIYTIKTSVIKLASKTHTEYTSNLPRTVTKEYTYVSGTMRRSSVTLKSNAQSFSTDITYSGTYSGTIGAAMTAANAIGIPISKKMTMGSDSSEWTMTYSSMNGGKLFRPTEVKCRRGTATRYPYGSYVWNSITWHTA